jgi:hypothetical protein
LSSWTALASRTRIAASRSPCSTAHLGALGSLGGLDRLHIPLRILDLHLQLNHHLGTSYPLVLFLGHDRLGQIQLSHQGRSILWIPYLLQAETATVLQYPVAFDLALELIAATLAVGGGLPGLLEQLSSALEGLIQAGSLSAQVDQPLFTCGHFRVLRLQIDQLDQIRVHSCSL